MIHNNAIDPVLLSEFYHNWNNASHGEKASMLAEFSKKVGYSQASIYRKLIQIRKGLGVVAVAKGEARRERYTVAEKARRLREAMNLAALKFPEGRISNPIPTERAIEIGRSMGILKLDLSRSGYDRLLQESGLNRPSFEKKKAARRLTADFPGQVFVVDATPMNHFYMELDKSIKVLHLPKGDTHAGDILATRKLYKIWVYYLIDMYSGAFLCMPYAPEPRGPESKVGGENSEDWWKFLEFCFLPKTDLSSIQTSDDLKRLHHPLRKCPVEGVPHILFCDQGSGIGRNKLVANLVTRLGGEIRTHFPGNPSAKGIIESKIKVSKQTFETQIQRRFFKTIEDLQFYYLTWAHYLNNTRGNYQAFRDGLKGQTLRSINPQNIQDACFTGISRTTDSYGCVSIQGEKFFVGEEYHSVPVTLWMRPDWKGSRVYVCETPDEKLHTCVPGEGIKASFIEKRVHRKKTNDEHIQELVVEMSKNVSEVMLVGDILPPDEEPSNIVHLPTPRTPVETERLLCPEKFDSIASAKKWIMLQTGFTESFLPEDAQRHLDFALDAVYEAQHHIPRQIVEHTIGLLNLIQQKQRMEKSV